MNPGGPDPAAQQVVPRQAERPPNGRQDRPIPSPLPAPPRPQQSLESISHILNELLGSIVDLAAEFDDSGKLLDIWSIDDSLLFGPIDQMLGKRLRDMIGEEAYRPFRDLFPRVHRSGKSETFEYTHDFPDGRRNFLGHAIPVDRPDGKPRTIRLLVQNITHWKKTEEHSRKIDALLAHTQELANVGSWEYDVAQRSFLWSDQLYRMLGMTPAAAPIPLREACLLFHPADRARVWQDVVALIESGRPLENELKFLSSDGSVRTFFSRATPYLNAEGGVHLIRGISQDITGRRAGEDRLRKSEALLAEAQQIAKIGSWEIDPQNNQAIWSENLYRILGRKPDSQPIDIGQFWHGTYADDMERTRSDFLRASAQGIAFDHESRFVLPDGQMRSLFVRGVPVLDSAGTLTRVAGITQDVTEQREAQRAHRESEEHYRLLVEGLKDYAIFALNCDGYVTSWNAGAEAIAGYTSNEILGRHFSTFYLPDDVASEKPIRELQQALNDGRLEAEGWRIRKDGSRFWADVVINPLRDEGGTLKGFATITRDMTDRRNADEEIRKRQAMLSQAEILAKMGSWEIDATENTVTWSEPLFRMLGVDAPASPAPLDKVWEIVNLENLEDTKKALGKSIRNCQTFNHIERYRAANGEIHTLHSRGIPVIDLQGRTVRLIGTTQDITERRRHEDELQRLSHQLLNVRDDEKRRIARKLHETTVQSMAAMKMLLGQVSDLIPKSSERVRTLLHSSSEIADEVISQVRTISHLLHPPLLDEAGLYPALRWYARGFADRSGITTTVEMDELFGRLAPETELAIFRVVQEALTNVHRHSGSADAIIRVRREPETVRVEVEDHGRGMQQVSATATQEARLGVGTAGMRERVLQFDGEFEIKSERDRGTTVCVRLSVPPTSENS